MSTSQALAEQAPDEQVPVLVVGAGLAGLSTAVFLGLHGVRPLLVERHPSTSRQPKARGQMPHTMEALRLAGLERRFRAASPKSHGFALRIAESATGPVFREILQDTFVQLSHLSPTGSSDVSQAKAEHILADRARELGADLRFSTELECFEQNDAGVTTTLHDRESGQRRTIRADYVVAADGHRSAIRDALGIGTHGRGSLAHTLLWLVRGDFGSIGSDDGMVLYYVRNERLPEGSGVVVSTDNADELVVGIDYDPQQGADFDAERSVEMIRVVTGIPDLVPDILEARTTELAMQVADRFSAGRVHLVGDAAHTMPPHGGMGGNTAIMDGFHLAWKLAAVVRGQAGPGLLASHDPERRAVGDFIADNQRKNATVRSFPHLADPNDAPPVEDPGMLCFGYRQSAAAVLEPGDAGELLEDPTEPTGRPGSRAPHVPLLTDAGEVSTIDLFGHGFVLLTGEDGAAWVDAAHEVASILGADVTAYRITRDGEFRDPSGGWCDRYGIAQSGVVLVRPDRFIAWRSPSMAGQPAVALEKALRTVLDR